MRVMFALTSLALLGLASAYPQGRCDSEGWPAAGIVEVGVYPYVYYVDDRNFVLGNGIWVYEESNGVYDDENGHLQRGHSCGGGARCTVPDAGEICTDVGEWDPDYLVY